MKTKNWRGSFFCKSMDLDSVLSINMQKKELCQYPAILTLCLVNSPYLSLIWHNFSAEKSSDYADVDVSKLCRSLLPLLSDALRRK